MGDYMAEAVVSQVKRIHTEIARAVRNCQNNLGANEDLIFQVASVPGVQVELFGIAYDMLNFGGVDSVGRKVLIMQHYSQANVVLTTTPRPEGSPPARPIGFLGAEE
jgi:hypothetical protein